MIHTVKDFSVVNKAEVGTFLELSCSFDDPTDVGDLISGFSAFLYPAEHMEVLCLYTAEDYPE